MKRTPITIPLSQLPESLRPFEEAAVIYDTSCSPEAYVRYSQQLKLEEGYAPDGEGPGPKGYGLQRS